MSDYITSTVAIFVFVVVLYYSCFLGFIWIIRRYTHCSPNAPSNASIKDIMGLYRQRCIELERMAEQQGVVLEDL
jgi:hypothetical protein